MPGTKRLSQRIRYDSWPIVAAVAALLVVLILLSSSLARAPQSENPAVSGASGRRGPPWRYGRIDARFTLIEYADLECPYCQAYFPVLMRWIDANPDVNWQWHHLPLAMHEPAATRQARLAECAGEIGGHGAFWEAVAWVYRNSLGNGRGLPSDAELPGATPVFRECLASTRPDAVIRAQLEEAAADDILATPTLRLVDNETGGSLLLPPGPVEGDALLSAIDLLASSSGAHADPPLE